MKEVDHRQKLVQCRKKIQETRDSLINLMRLEQRLIKYVDVDDTFDKIEKEGLDNIKLSSLFTHSEIEEFPSLAD
jgi:hypothetical protein